VTLLRSLSYPEFVCMVGAAVDSEDWMVSRGNVEYNRVRAATLIAELTAR
jgi:hypothetical protein